MLLGLAKENIGHYQKTADLENGLHLTGIPTPIAENMPPQELKEGEKEPAKVYLGAKSFLTFDSGRDSNKLVNVKFLEFKI
jgi:hypothetical protein